MAIRYTCDRCGRGLDSNDPNRFVVKIEAYAAADQLTITEEDLARDHQAEMQRIIKQLDGMSPDAIENQTYRSFRFDLCRECHAEYLKNPISPTSR